MTETEAAVRQRWRVVAGKVRQGILVREGHDLRSSKCSERLSRGAVVDELDFRSGRLRYRLVEGEGPGTGWVSVSLARPAGAMELLERLPEAAPGTPRAAAEAPAPRPEARERREEAAPPRRTIVAAPPPSPPPPCGDGATGVQLHVDSGGVLRGGCSACESCAAFRCGGGSPVDWSQVLKASRAGAPSPQDSRRCLSCGCAAGSHADLTCWFSEVSGSVRRFRDPMLTKRLPPSKWALPVESVSWAADDVALHVLTCGLFVPRRKTADAGGSAAKDGEGGSEAKMPIDAAGTCSDAGAAADVSGGPVASCAPLVSVCAPTSTKRHGFHPLLYNNFASQRYERKELVVVDTGREPSRYLQQKAAEDQRVRYFFYPVHDSVRDRQQAALKAISPVSARAAASKHYVPSPDCWSLGLKRNLTIAHARGDVMAHFDDDDLYSPMYLEFMVEKLQEELRWAPRDGPGVGLGGLPGIVKLSEWHLFDFAGRTFRHIDPQTDPGVQDSWRKPMLYGYGFSYVYTRRAWQLEAFPDTEDCEDDVFIQRLRDLRGARLGLLKLPSRSVGLVAHSFHADNTGVSEFNGSKRLGTRCPPPEGFEGLLQVVMEVAGRIPSPPQAPPQPMPAVVGVRRSYGKGLGKGFGKGLGKGARDGALLVGRAWAAGRRGQDISGHGAPQLVSTW